MDKLRQGIEELLKSVEEDDKAEETEEVEVKEEEVETPETKTFDEQMDLLAKDEQEAIDEYEKVIAQLDDEGVKAQLEKILAEEKAHKEFLEKVKEDCTLKYKEPEGE